MAAFESSSNLLNANDNAQPSTSTLPPRSLPPPVVQANDDDSAISVHLPERLLVLPPAAFALGAFVGLSRGGSRARLRFLAENAHRPPTTVQGWVRIGHWCRSDGNVQADHSHHAHGSTFTPKRGIIESCSGHVDRVPRTPSNSGRRRQCTYWLKREFARCD